MKFVKHNDFEIIYEIREGNQEALNLMFDKYKHLISKKIYKFNLQYEYDDMYQEALMILYKSIRFFSEIHSKSFTKYFEMNLNRKFITIVTKKRRRYEIFSSNEAYIYEHNHDTNQSSVYYELYKKEIAKILTKQELLVYTLRELHNFSVSYISKNAGIKEKVIYNSLHRAKAKIKIHFKN
jgi:RNA polymerase sporulation-specific sigma factor